MDEKDLLYFAGDESSFKKFNLTFSNSYKISSVLPENKGELLVLVFDYKDMAFTIRLLDTLFSSYSDVIVIVIASDFSFFGHSIFEDKIYSYVKRPFNNFVLSKVLESAFSKRRSLLENSNLLSKLDDKNSVIDSLEKKLSVNGVKDSSYNILARSFSHEVKNQLNTIGYLDLIFNSLDDIGRKYINTIYRSRDMIITLVNEFVALSSNKNISYKRKAYSISSFINEFVSFIKVDPSISPININIYIDKNYRVLMNKIKITQVLINLVYNSAYSINSLLKSVISRSYNRSKRSVDFYKDKYINIRVVGLGDFVEISVIDNGRGIEKCNIERIWNNSFTTKGRLDRGIGLGVCRKIVMDGHSGDIYCFSKPYKETIFSFTLPLARVNSGEDNVRKLPKESSSSLS